MTLHNTTCAVAAQALRKPERLCANAVSLRRRPQHLAVINATRDT
jgi:hypothetical protein